MTTMRTARPLLKYGRLKISNVPSTFCRQYFTKSIVSSLFMSGCQEEEKEELEKAVVKIQAGFRGFKARKEMR